MDSDAENELWKNHYKSWETPQGNQTQKKSQKPKRHKELRTKGGNVQMALKNTTNTKEKAATKAP